MNRLYKYFIAIVTAVLLSAAMASTALAGTTYSAAWVKDAANNWHAKGADGKYLKNCWFCDDAVTANGKNVWYLIDANGNMIAAGLVQDGTGNFYSIETNSNGYFGMLRYQNGTYNCNGKQVYLEFNQTHGGSFGAIKNAEGLEALKSIYGVTSVANINNSNAVYSSSYISNMAAGPGEVAGGSGSASGGGGGGGGSSSGGGGGSSSGSGSSGAGGNTSQSNEETNVINQFKANYISAGMSDFEKEMAIIMWMVENIDYDVKWCHSGSVTSARSYESLGALIDKVAVCDGYSKAFVKLAQACNLTVKRVSGTANGEGHSWNQIRLNGKWYNVDVTWEDPYIGSKESCRPNDEYGFWNLRNNYINVTDAHFTSHRASTSKESCTSDEFGPDVVAYYLEHHEYKPMSEVAGEFETESEQIIADYVNEGYRKIIYENPTQLENAIVDYVLSRINDREWDAQFIITYGNAYDRSVTGDYTKISNMINSVKTAAKERINAVYAPISSSGSGLSLYFIPSELPNHRMYSQQKIYLNYSAGNKKPVELTVNYIDIDREETVKTDSITTEVEGNYDCEFPDGYQFVRDGREGVIEGNASLAKANDYLNTARIHIARISDDVIVNLYVRRKGAPKMLLNLKKNSDANEIDEDAECIEDGDFIEAIMEPSVTEDEPEAEIEKAPFEGPENIMEEVSLEEDADEPEIAEESAKEE